MGQDIVPQIALVFLGFIFGIRVGIWSIMQKFNLILAGATRKGRLGKVADKVLRSILKQKPTPNWLLAPG